MSSSGSSTTTNQAILFGRNNIVCIDAILCIRGDADNNSIEVQFTDNKTLTVVCGDPSSYRAAMKYLFMAINNKLPADDHNWLAWEQPQEEDENPEDDDEEIIRVAPEEKAPKSPFPEYMRLGESIAAKMPMGEWQIVVVSGLDYRGPSPTVTVESRSEGTRRLMYEDYRDFAEIRPDRHSDKKAQDCVTWLNKPVLYLPENNVYVLHRGEVLGASMSNHHQALSIRPGHLDDCIEVPINRVYAILG